MQDTPTIHPLGGSIQEVFALSEALRFHVFPSARQQPPLARALAAQKIVGSTYLFSQLGPPFASGSAVGNKFRKWVAEAGLKDRSPHGIRKAAGELIAFEGASQYHIMADRGPTQVKTSAFPRA